MISTTILRRAISAIVGIPGQLEPYLDGLRQLPRVATLAQRDVVRFERDWTATSQRLDAEHKLASWRIERETLRGEIDTLKAELSLEQQQLAAEREKHAETKRLLNDARSNVGASIDTLNQFSNDHYERFTELQKTKKELAAALDKLDKLTRWNLEKEFQCPKRDPCELFAVRDGTLVDKMIIRAACNMKPTDYWRHTPESLQALEESEGGDG